MRQNKIKVRKVGEVCIRATWSTVTFNKTRDLDLSLRYGHVVLVSG